MKPLFPLLLALACFALLASPALSCAALPAYPVTEEQNAPEPSPGGEMLVFDMEDSSVHLGTCPLKKTEVNATILGAIVRTTVRQTFENTFDRPVTTKYLFPLPENSAVDDMTMVIGNRRIIGEIHERAEAQAIYDEAVEQGHTASLLNQERPNCFSQRIANVEPGAEIQIEISFIESLVRRDGLYEWDFPMVVGEHYFPESMDKMGEAVVDTEQVANAADLLVPIAPPEVRAGHTISLTVDILAATELYSIESELHEIDVTRTDIRSARVTLAQKGEIPNRDFILRFKTGGDEISEGLFLHENEQGTYFTLFVEPPRRAMPEQILPREVVFVIDASGSMGGFPIEKAKETMRKCIETLGPDDTFNLLAFSSNTGGCFDEPMPNSRENVAKALGFLGALNGSGGTEMIPAIQAALGGVPDPERLRIVCFMTDGYIWNDYELLSEVQKNADVARVFSFGIGSGVNRYLLNQMAQLGRGDVTYVTKESDADAAAEQFLARIHAPVLRDIGIDWGNLPVEQVTPAAIPDLFDEKPIIVHGRLLERIADLEAVAVTVRGKTVSGLFERSVGAASAEQEWDSSVIPKLWARSRIHDLMLQDLSGAQRWSMSEELRAKIIDVSVSHRVLSDYTAFVAVEKVVKIDPETSMEVLVPLETVQGIVPTATQDWALLLSGLALVLVGSSLLWTRKRHGIA